MQKTARFSATYLLVALLFSTAAAPASAQSHPEYIPLGGGVKAVLYRPDSNPSPHVGVIIIHRTANYLQQQCLQWVDPRGWSGARRRAPGKHGQCAASHQSRR